MKEETFPADPQRQGGRPNGNENGGLNEITIINLY